MTILREAVDAGAVDLTDTVDPAAEPLPPVTPGEILQDWMEDAGLSARALARALCVPANRITSIVNGDRAISAETAMRLGRYFGTSARFWVNLQSSYDLKVAERSAAARVIAEVRPRAA